MKGKKSANHTSKWFGHIQKRLRKKVALKVKPQAAPHNPIGVEHVLPSHTRARFYLAQNIIAQARINVFKSRKIWNTCLISLPIDLALFALLTTYPIKHLSWNNGFEVLFWVCVAVSVIAMNHVFITSVMFRVIDLRKRLSNSKLQKSHVPLTILAHSLPIILFAVMAALLEQYVVALIVVGVGVKGALNLKQDHENWTQHKRAEIDNRLYWLQQMNTLVYRVTIVPILSCRIACALITIRAATDHYVLWNYLSNWLILFAILWSLVPEKEQIIDHCPSCAQYRPLALKGFRNCPSCNINFFAVRREENLVKSAYQRTWGSQRKYQSRKLGQPRRRTTKGKNRAA